MSTQPGAAKRHETSYYPFIHCMDSGMSSTAANGVLARLEDGRFPCWQD